MSHHSVPTRRSVVRAAAWSLPAVAVAAQAPAFAASGAADGFAFIPGGTRVVEADNPNNTNRWYDLRFEGASVRAGAGGVAAGGLTLSLRWVPDADVAAGARWGFMDSVPSGWSSSVPAGNGVYEGVTVVLTWPAAVSPGGVVALTDGIYLGTNTAWSLGTYFVDVSAPGEDVQQAQFRWEGPVPKVVGESAASDAEASRRRRTG